MGIGRMTIIGAAALALGQAGALAAEPGEEDPLLRRYEGAEMRGHQESMFDEVILPVGPLTDDGAPSETLVLTGRVTWIAYQLPDERSVLEIARNYEQALAEDGYEIVFACAGQECGEGSRFHQHLYRSGDVIRGGSRMLWRIGSHNSRARYMVAHREDAEISAHIMLHIVEGGERRYVRQVVVENEPMQSGLVETGARAAEELQAALDTEGRAVVDGIFFDFDSADILPESAEALEQMAILLRDAPGISVYIVGHTDDQGDLEYNTALSARRAQAVLDALAGGHGIAAGRMQAHGVASLAPVASNASEDGRAMNRRVELVLQ
jgi:OmpA-OmpF porin, OOP family